MRPAEVFHPSESIVEEATVRGWTVWDVARRMGDDAPVNVLALQLYAMRDPDGRMDPKLLERAFGVSAAFWAALEGYWRDHPEARAQIDDEAAFLAWYEIDEGDTP